MLRLPQLFAAALLLSAISQAPAEDSVLKVGDKAPTFSAQDDTGKEWSSADHVGKKIVVVYFYPADCTGGCTKQAIGFTKDAKALADAGVEVVGVSGDSVKNHQLFKKKESIGITLLADENGAVATAFGVPFTPGEKSVKAIVDGKEETLVRGGTAKRWTFVIGKDGKIAHKNEMVDAANDSQAIMKVVKGL
jgi:peroxiredoxin Q/BCP